MQQGRTINSKQQDMILENKQLVKYFANRFGNYQNDVEYDDYVAEGMIGLVKAANTFDKSKGIKFVTYASTCIQNEIIMYLRKQRKHQICISIEEAVLFERESGDKLKITDTLEAPNSSCIEMIERQEELEKCINLIINVLNKREIDIVKYIFFEEKPQVEIAEIFEISQSYVSRLQKRIQKKIRNYYEDNMIYKEEYSFEISNGLYKLSIYDENKKEIKVVSKSISNPNALNEILTFVSSLKEK